ncbi:MAG: ATP-binding protein [Flavobacteriaceae bacterium]|nr:ATP-binding protein [Flavobacteriaceae bacterium]
MMPSKQLLPLLQQLGPDQADIIRHYSLWPITAREEQKTPKGNWTYWLVLAGRGWGKTRTGAEDVAFYGLQFPGSRIAVAAPTISDARDTCIEGESGLLSVLPSALIKTWNRSLGELVLKNGTRYKTFSADEPDRFRGPQHHRAWCDEIAAWKYPDSFDQLLFGLRLGDTPQVVITTTPRPTPLIKTLIEDQKTVVTRGSTFDNSENLAPSMLEQLKKKYDGTRLGRQELYAEVLTDTEGALWSYDLIDGVRIEKNKTPQMQRIIVAIDPAVTNTELSDETGIVVVGMGVDERYYVLEDASGKMSPDGWGRAAVDCYYNWQADRIVAEINNGGDLVERLIRTIDNTVPYTPVRASRGKITRAEPIAALYEQKKVSHAGSFAELEDQMTTYVGGSGKSPDRLDALVWALTELSQSSGKAYWRIS